MVLRNRFGHTEEVLLDGVFDHDPGCRHPDYGPCTCKRFTVQIVWVPWGCIESEVVVSEFLTVSQFSSDGNMLHVNAIPFLSMHRVREIRLNTSGGTT